MAETGGHYLGLQAGMTPEEGLGFDVQRFWANGVQFTYAGSDGFFVFREQVKFENTGHGETKDVTKNVVSVVMPLASVFQIRDLLNNLFPAESSGSAAA